MSKEKEFEFIRLLEKDGTTLIDSVSCDYEDSFSLEAFGDMFAAHDRVGKPLIVARVQTWDHKQPDRAFYSYYDGHNLNKILFQTQIYLGKKLIHRLHVLNPLTNTDIIGDVQYFAVRRCKKEALKPIKDVGSVIASAEAINHVVNIPTDTGNDAGPSSTTFQPPSKALRFQFHIRKETHESDADEENGTDDDNENTPLTPLKQNNVDLVRRLSTTRRKSTGNEENDEEMDVPMPLGGGSSGSTNGSKSSKGKGRSRQVTIPSSIDTMPSGRLRGMSAMSASVAAPKNFLDLAVDFGRQLNDFTFGPATALPEENQFGGRRRNYSFAGVEMARIGRVRQGSHPRSRTEVPPGAVTQYSKPIDPNQFDVPTTPRTRARKLSLSNYSPASPSIDAQEFHKWIKEMRDAADGARKDRSERKMSLGGDQPLPSRGSQDLKSSSNGTRIPSPIKDLPALLPKNASAANASGSTKLEMIEPDQSPEPCWLEGIFIGTDNDFLESSAMRLIFKEAALAPEDAILFEMQEFRGLPGEAIIPSAQALVGANGLPQGVPQLNPEDPLLRSVDETGRDILNDDDLDDETELSCGRKLRDLLYVAVATSSPFYWSSSCFSASFMPSIQVDQVNPHPQTAPQRHEP